MRKSISKKIPLILATALCACGLQACWADSNLDCEYRTKCNPVCHNYCETVTDGWFVWDDCWETCEDSCHTIEVCREKPECYTDYDCRNRGGACINGQCFAAPNNHGNAGLCESCNTGNDCRENGALCIALDNNIQVCGRSCNSNSDCPSRYDCMAMEGSNGKQCVPRNFSCNASSCKKDSDCSENGSCIDGACVLDNDNINECQTYKDCKGMTTVDGTAELNVCVMHSNTDGSAANYCTIDCYGDNGCDAGYYCFLTKNDLDSGVCFRGMEQGCVYDSDCEHIDKSLICRNAKCSVPCRMDSDCKASNPNAVFTCNNGACVFSE